MSSVEHVIVTQRSRPAWEYFEYQPDLDISICKVDSVDIQQCGTGKEINKLDKTYLKSRHEEVYSQHWDVNVSLRKRPSDSSTAAE